MGRLGRAHCVLLSCLLKRNSLLPRVALSLSYYGNASINVPTALYEPCPDLSSQAGLFSHVPQGWRWSISDSPLAAEVLNPRLEKTSVFQTHQLELTPLSSKLVRVSGEGLGVR